MASFSDDGCIISGEARGTVKVRLSLLVHTHFVIPPFCPPFFPPSLCLFFRLYFLLPFLLLNFGARQFLNYCSHQLTVRVPLLSLSLVKRRSSGRTRTSFTVSAKRTTTPGLSTASLSQAKMHSAPPRIRPLRLVLVLAFQVFFFVVGGTHSIHESAKCLPFIYHIHIYIHVLNIEPGRET